RETHNGRLGGILASLSTCTARQERRAGRRVGGNRELHGLVHAERDGIGGDADGAGLCGGRRPRIVRVSGAADGHEERSDRQGAAESGHPPRQLERVVHVGSVSSPLRVVVPTIPEPATALGSTQYWGVARPTKEQKPYITLIGKFQWIHNSLNTKVIDED